jgi:hypothetical protein
MKHLRQSRFLSILLAILIVVGYCGIGFSEHICYSYNERIVSLSLVPPVCNHQSQNDCCNEHQALSCDADEACCAFPTPESLQELMLKPVCCVDHHKYHNLSEEVVHTVSAAKVMLLVSATFLCLTINPDNTDNFKEQNHNSCYKPPPVPLLKKPLLFHQLRLDPDLA